MLLKPGERLRSISAFDINGAIEAGQAYRKSQEGFMTQVTPTSASGQTICRIFNTIIPLESYPRYSVFAITKPFFDPDLNDQTEMAFKTGTNFAIEKPKADSTIIAITAGHLLPIANIGTQAVIAGVSIVKINRTDGTHRWARPIDNDTSKLESSESGLVEILTTEDWVGTRYEYVRFGSPAGDGGGGLRFGVVKNRPSGGGGAVSWYEVVVDGNGNWSVPDGATPQSAIAVRL